MRGIEEAQPDRRSQNTLAFCGRNLRLATIFADRKLT